MKKTTVETILEEVLKDSPQHLKKLIDLRTSLGESTSEYLQADAYKKECRKQVDADDQARRPQ